MPTKGQFSSERNVKNISGRDGQKKGNSLPDQIAPLPKDRVAAVNGNGDRKFVDRIRVAKNDKFRRQRESLSGERSACMKGSKPWPSRKTTTVDELVKHMSNVPSYLQHKETADHRQDKALNVGVLEWGLLANWSQQQKHDLARSHGTSPSNTSRSVLFSSPSHSSASPSSRSLESNQSTPVNDHHHSSIRGQQSRLADKHHGTARYSPSPNSAVLSLLPAHGKHPCPETSSNYVGSGLSNVSLPSDSLGSSSRSCGRPEMDEDEESRRIEDIVHHCSRRLFTDSDSIGKNLFTSNNNDSDPEQSSVLNGQNFEPQIPDAAMDTPRNGSRLPDVFLEDIEPSHEFPRIPHSCPLPIIDSAAKEIHTTSTEARNNFVGTAAKVSKNSNQNRSAMSGIENPPQCSAKFSDRMPDRYLGAGTNRVNRSSSLKETPCDRQPDVGPSGDKIGDRSSSNSKGRRSPLRRMLDPILKPRHSSPVRPSFVPKCHLPVNTPKQSLDMGGSVPQNVQRRSVDMVVNSNYPTEACINQPPHVLLNSARYLQQEKDSPTTRQALLQLAWKNGLPLFMMSYGESGILAATVRKKGISEKDDLESTYAVFTVEEPKKKSGTWIKAGGKNKKHHLLSSIVGELKVSHRKSRCHHTKNAHVHREFVLVGSEYLPSSEESGDSHISGELAAFISALPQQEAETSNQSSSQNMGQSDLAPSGCGCPPLGNFQPSTRNANSGSANVIAVLPDGFHGTSTSGQPLPLIERWKSGGACDCGGWDEGCTLSVLTGMAPGNGAVQANQAMDGSQRFELVAQGRLREDRNAFSMTSFKEGLYTVEFRSSIALLQAFAMCIVMLHGRWYPNKMQVASQAVQERDLLANHELKTMAAIQSRAPTSYVPHRPPLSPVGRA
ncbi:uncharacterized protein LOC120693232 [Panicum virgatum]|uniref:Uncharacterized protein n=1 Tax=Panicum virgatum TaxID=38727 RepID=A0A8T0MYS6_PANVG|nr:uncharacterized protein LOC120693232 [Panicum virgatum]XP_039832576.1 uncharacterized protein LOC120693232 [Panicum virgatum]XP_039832577.1 uncharacterized protein LOC120693232 [Panicum virgatum]KAG2541868.1 hypothetical protein PVAP13_9NG705600 [Panicum virgatum]